MHWRRKWQPTPVFLPGELQGRRSLVVWRLWGRTESDMTERLSSSSSSNREAWRAAIPAVTKSQTRLSNWTELKVATILKINIGKLCQWYDEIVCPFTMVRSIYFFRLLDYFVSSFPPVLLLMQTKFKIDRTFINQGLTFCLEKYIKKKDKKI